MAGLGFSYTTPAVSLTSGTERTLFQAVAPTNQGFFVRKFIVTFSGGAAADPMVQIRVMKQTTAGTMTSGTPVKTAGGAETIQTTVKHSATSTEPTYGDVMGGAVYVHPTQPYMQGFAYGELRIAGGERFAITALSASSGLSAVVYFSGDE